ncbi:macrophage mannose receptor 1-like isoform X1 [Astyanax mexicanus]|uniref:Macrophage mannose receptor 1-like isoform X1 n=1 Tax=Astyanax mexicanus TaxID=7994 RepID=A0A8T2LQW3_ASTMX|nr:macrophage mannose receptor 1-like isoform X1 [Astyanax mexicanus]
MEDMNRLVALVNGSFNGSAWIGLHNVINPWRWSEDDSNPGGPAAVTYFNWYSGRPLDGQCVWKLKPLYSGLWSDVGCNVAQHFICHDARPEALNPYVRIALYMNFTDAQSYCRQHYTDLATARDQTEDAVIGSYQSSNHLYIGLYRTSTLTWADGNNSTFSFWGAGHPHLYQGAPYCTSTSISDSGRWTDQLCTDTLPFVCHTVQTDPVVGMRVRFRTWRNLSDSEIQDMVSQKIKQQLVGGGLPNDITVAVRQVIKRSP